MWKKPPEMTARHPLGKVPYMEEDGLTVYDSTVIDEYLEERYSWPRLLPEDPVMRAKARMLEQFADEAILGGNLPPVWMAYWSDPDKRDPERMEKGREGLRARDLPYLEKLLGEPPAGDYLLGGFSMADVPMMVLAMVLEVDKLALDRFAKLEKYLTILRERPSYRAIGPRTKVADALSLRNFE
ncbi:MAG: glutathione S-transferase family protein [Deltaproteobacteria bacterium]|nr:glutathione S-transferase family protein [Deltaproteobacteria bacterium]